MSEETDRIETLLRDLLKGRDEDGELRLNRREIQSLMGLPAAINDIDKKVEEAIREATDAKTSSSDLHGAIYGTQSQDGMRIEVDRLKQERNSRVWWNRAVFVAGITVVVRFLFEAGVWLLGTSKALPPP